MEGLIAAAAAAAAASTSCRFISSWFRGCGRTFFNEGPSFDGSDPSVLETAISFLVSSEQIFSWPLSSQSLLLLPCGSSMEGCLSPEDKIASKVVRKLASSLATACCFCWWFSLGFPSLVLLPRGILPRIDVVILWKVVLPVWLRL